MGGPGGPMPVSSSGAMTIPTGPGSDSPHGSNPGTPLGGSVPMGPSSHPGNIPMGPSSHPGMGGHQSPGMGHSGPSPGHHSMGGPSPVHPGMGGPSPGHPSMGGPSPNHPSMGHPSPVHPGMGGPSPVHPGMGGPGPLSMSSEKIYPSDQPMVFNPQNPNAPPIYPCGICHKEVHDNDQVRQEISRSPSLLTTIHCRQFCASQAVTSGSIGSAPAWLRQLSTS